MIIVGIIGSIGLIIFASWLLIAVRRESTLRAPLIGAVVCLILTLTGVSNSWQANAPSKPTATNDPGTILGSLKVSYQITKTHNTDNKTQIIFLSKNVSNDHFSGNLEVKSLNQDGIYMDMEVIHFFNLPPGQSRSSICWLSLDQPPHLQLSSTNQ